MRVIFLLVVHLVIFTLPSPFDPVVEVDVELYILLRLHPFFPASRDRKRDFLFLEGDSF